MHFLGKSLFLFSNFLSLCFFYVYMVRLVVVMIGKNKSERKLILLLSSIFQVSKPTSRPKKERYMNGREPRYFLPQLPSQICFSIAVFIQLQFHVCYESKRDAAQTKNILFLHLSSLSSSSSSSCDIRPRPYTLLYRIFVFVVVFFLSQCNHFSFQFSFGT